MYFASVINLECYTHHDGEISGEYFSQKFIFLSHIFQLYHEIFSVAENLFSFSHQTVHLCSNLGFESSKFLTAQISKRTLITCLWNSQKAKKFRNFFSWFYLINIADCFHKRRKIIPKSGLNTCVGSDFSSSNSWLVIPRADLHTWRYQKRLRKFSLNLFRISFFRSSDAKILQKNI